MSYCRFSYHSDVYCYESCHGGWVVNVATRRHVSSEPYPEMLDGWWKPEVDPNDVLKAYQAQMKWYREASLEPITIDPPAEDQCLSTPLEAAEYLEHLKSMGYIVPQEAIDALRDEALNPETEA